MLHQQVGEVERIGDRPTAEFVPICNLPNGCYERPQLAKLVGPPPRALALPGPPDPAGVAALLGVLGMNEAHVLDQG